jgi:hypothetical protein
MKDPAHEEYEERLEWLGGEFDPEKFNPDSTKFDNPELRLKMVLSRN